MLIFQEILSVCSNICYYSRKHALLVHQTHMRFARNESRGHTVYVWYNLEKISSKTSCLLEVTKYAIFTGYLSMDYRLQSKFKLKAKQSLKSQSSCRSLTAFSNTLANYLLLLLLMYQNNIEDRKWKMTKLR